MNTRSQLDYQIKIIVLWTVFLLGTIFHTQLALMPLFHGFDVAIVGHQHDAESSQTIAEIAPILWGMLAFFAIPMVAIVTTAFSKSQGYRVFHFWLTIVYTVLNFLHVVLDLFVEPLFWYQIVLMTLLFGFGIVLNFTSYQWMKFSLRRQRI
ncbi:MAG: hypothetical protein QNJ55_13355 [Xenococcus sp. MO_188.B8]|nr:hypothetical protein [Xenococcus sp. MO_188.B8]